MLEATGFGHESSGNPAGSNRRGYFFMNRRSSVASIQDMNRSASARSSPAASAASAKASTPRDGDAPGQDRRRLRTEFGTNHLGHFVFVNRIAPLIRDGGRLVNLASAGHRFADETF